MTKDKAIAEYVRLRDRYVSLAYARSMGLLNKCIEAELDCLNNQMNYLLNIFRKDDCNEYE